MNGLDNGFFFVIDKIVSMQSTFISYAWSIGKVAFTISLLSAAFKYAVSGQGIKESVVKILIATVFFACIMKGYPAIVGKITTWTFDMARAAAWDQDIEGYYNASKAKIAEHAEDMAAENKKGTYATTVTGSQTVSEDKNPALYFSDIITPRQSADNTLNYTVVAPAAVLRVVLLVAGECFRSADEAPERGAGPFKFQDVGAVIKGTVCAFFVIFTGIFAILEYLIAFLEFMLVTSVGIIIFPLMLWDGSKFMSEKFIGAVIGFFIKLLFCNICIFLMLYGFLSLAKRYTQVPFTGLADEIMFLVFTCLLFFSFAKARRRWRSRC